MVAKKRINTAAKGRRLEHKTIRVLEAAGYDCTRAAASKGTWDIVAMNEDNLRLIQVKAGRVQKSNHAFKATNGIKP